MEYRFEDYAKKILEALESKRALGIFEKNGDKDLIIQDSFATISMRPKISPDIELVGQYMPLVFVVGKQSGLVYQFRLVDLVPEIELK